MMTLRSHSRAMTSGADLDVIALVKDSFTSVTQGRWVRID
jgi:hypothetical protein